MHNLEQDLQLVRKITWTFVQRHYGMEFDDLFSEACLIYLQATRHYDSSRGAWSTFIWNSIHNHLHDLIAVKYRHDRKELPTELKPDWLPSDTTPEECILAKEQWQSIMVALSPTAQAICEIVLEQYWVYLPTDKPRKCRGILTRLLRQRGWSWSAIRNGFQEIRQIVRA